MIRETPEIRDRVNNLYKKYGTITPEHIVEDAKDPKSPLHSLFEWNVQAAARQHWLDTAREVIRCVRVTLTVETKQVETVAYLHTTGQEQGYTHVSSVRSDKQAALDTLTAEFQRAADILRRCREVAVALNLESEVDRLLVEVGAVREVVRLRRAKLSTAVPSVRKPVRVVRRP